MELGCPECGGQDFCSIEENVRMVNPFVMCGEEPEWHSEPEILWDGVKIVGITCEECNWEAEIDNDNINAALVQITPKLDKNEEDIPDDDF